MSYIDDVKSRLDIVDVVGQYLELDRKGRIYRSLCPFHSERDPSFIVFPDSQRWQCFGSCNTGGDLFDFVQRREGWDFGTALRELGRQAGLEPPTWSEEQRQRHAAKRDYEAGLAAAADFWRGQLLDGENPGRAYCVRRGFSEATIESGRLGYAPEDGLGALKAHLQEQGVALDGRAGRVAQKVQGYAFYKGGALVYIHVERGRVVYLSARAVQADVEAHETKYNPPINRLSEDGRTVLGKLAGSKRTFVVGRPVQQAESILVIEGQACALTAVLEWEAVDTAVAIAGSGLDDEALFQQIAEARRRYVGLDDDETGHARRGEIAERMGALTRIVTWPVHDANDLQRIAAGTLDAPEGFEPPDDVQEYVAELLRASPTYLDTQIAEYQALDDPAESAQMAEHIAELYGDLSKSIRMQLKPSICERMGIGKRDLDALVRTVMERRLSTVPYSTQWGMLCRQAGLADDGTPKWTPLAPLDCRVVEEAIHDNGIQRQINFVIEGSLNDGTRLPTITVEAEDYHRLGWMTGQWGAAAYPMEASPHHLRRAILELSEPERTTCYTHVGWRVIDGHRVYLFNGGGVGSNGRTVDVEVDDSRLQGYVLPEAPDDPQEAMQASLRFLGVTDLRITGPLWAAMYLAPLSEIVEPDFVVFVYGKTGAMKSTITALALNHYGADWDYNRMPANWNDTRTALEMKAFLVKDAPLVVDDYARDVQLARAHDKKAEYLIRNWANRTSRARRTSNLSAQQNFPPRGLVISSGEQLPSGQSIIGRSFPIEVMPSDLASNAAAMQRLNDSQNECELYNHAMSGYLLWLRERWETLADNIPRAWSELRDHERFASMSHLRIPAVIAKLYVGFDLGMKYAVSLDVLDHEQAQEWRTQFFDALLQDAMDHSILVEEEDPVDRFIRIIRDSFAQGRIWVEGVDGITDIPFQDRTAYAEKLGFVDQDWLYLFGEATVSYVQGYGRRAGNPFPLNRNALYSGLVEAGVAISGTNYTTMQYRTPDGQNQRVLKLKAARFGLSPQEEPKPEPVNL